MKLEEYQSGKYVNMENYKAFIPSNINYNWGWDDTKLDKLLAEANRQLGELNAYSVLIPNVDLYIKMHVKIEANKSSRIEGTRTTIEEDLMDVIDVDPEKRDDWEEVQNYVKAINYGIERIKSGFPVCTRLIREIHKVLMTGVRGEHKTPGEFRISQNWIGGSMPSKAVYVPPPHTEIAKDKFKKVVEFTKEMDRKILNMTVKPENARKVLDVLYDEPAVNRKKLVELTGITESTIKNIINNFVDKGILVETTGYTRNQIFKFQKYTDLFLK